MSSEYAEKKEMSAKLFKYFIDADDEMQADLSIVIQLDLQDKWRMKIQQNPGIKLDDMGNQIRNIIYLFNK